MCSRTIGSALYATLKLKKTQGSKLDMTQIDDHYDIIAICLPAVP